MNYIGINLTKVVKDMYTEKYNTLLRGIKENLNKSTDISCPWMGRSQYYQHGSSLQTDL